MYRLRGQPILLLQGVWPLSVAVPIRALTYAYRKIRQPYAPCSSLVSH